MTASNTRPVRDQPTAEEFQGVSETLTIDSTNGEPIQLSRFAPQDPPGARAVVLISPAIATEARFYRRLAHWLTEQGLIAYYFDHQGYGASARTPLKEVQADFLTWTTDAQAALEFVARREKESGLPIRWLGHSLGGQMLAFVNHDLLEKAMVVSAGMGYWKFWRHYGTSGLPVPLLWHGIAPAVVKLTGYFPGKTLGILGDLPGPVMTQWARWCTLPRYMLTEHPEFAEQFSSYSHRLDFVTFSDDNTMPLPASLSLMNWYSGADVHHVHYSPEELGREKIDHMGIFRSRNADLWPQVFRNLIT